MELEPYRGELVAYCYRMLGSFHDAEDLAQEIMLRAWKARDRYDPGLASVRTWLYRIAANACQSHVEGRARRPLPSGLGAPGDDIGVPLTPALDIPWLEPFPDARFDPQARADVRLALVAAVQCLPPRQRAVLLLREVLQFSAAEVAGQLEMTVAAVNSALQRARAAMSAVDDAAGLPEPGDPKVRAVVDQYVRAFEAADVPGLVRLLADDAILEMPPVPLWYRGSRDYGLFMERVFTMRPGRWMVRTLTANGQPALATYAPDPATGRHRLHSLQVLTVREARVTRNVVFADPSAFAPFALEQQIPALSLPVPSGCLRVDRSPGLPCRCLPIGNLPIAMSSVEAAGMYWRHPTEEIIVSVIFIGFSTLDGVVSDPDGSGGTPGGGWAWRHRTAAQAGAGHEDEFKIGSTLESGVLLLGRKTWEFFAARWPHRDTPFARQMNGAAKLVATRAGVDTSAWANSSAIDGDVAKVIGSESRDVVITGSLSVVRVLQQADLIDEYRVLTYPALLGEGARLFPEGTPPAYLRFHEAESEGPALFTRWTRER